MSTIRSSKYILIDFFIEDSRDDRFVASRYGEVVEIKIEADFVILEPDNKDAFTFLRYPGSRR